MKRNLLGCVMRYGTNKEKNTKLGEGLRRLVKESHGIRKRESNVVRWLRHGSVVNMWFDCLGAVMVQS